MRYAHAGRTSGCREHAQRVLTAQGREIEEARNRVAIHMHFFRTSRQAHRDERRSRERRLLPPSIERCAREEIVVAHDHIGSKMRCEGNRLIEADGGARHRI